MDDVTFQRLCRDLLAGELDPGEAGPLLAHLRARPDLLDELGRSLAVDRLLPLAAEPAAEAGHFSGEVVQRIQTAPQAEVFARSVRQRITPPKRRRPAWSKLALPLAAVLVLLAVGTFLLASPAPLARVAAADGVSWSAGTGAAKGDLLEAGETLEMESGLLALTLPGRGTIVLEGACSLTVLGEKRFALDRGRATFTVTPGGRGLAVTTPHGTVVDLGTAFALEVDESTCELHVIEGEVEFSGPEGGPARPLLAGQSLRAAAGGVTDIPSDTDRFVRHVPTIGDNRSHLRWSLQDGSGSLASAAGEAGSAPLELRSAFPDGPVPLWDSAEGRRGLRFDGDSSYAVARFPGVLGSTPRTVALWVRVPASWTPEEGGTLVAWGRSEWQVPGLLFELTLNRDPAKGPLGAPQLDTYGHTATAAVPINDDRWHHLAVTTFQGSGDGGNTQVLFHLDGRLIGSAPRAIPLIDTVASGGGGELVVGRSIQGLASPEPPAEAFFRGLLSDIVVVEGGLRGQEIRKVMTSGQPW